jgi:hypothetical protein
MRIVSIWDWSKGPSLDASTTKAAVPILPEPASEYLRSRKEEGRAPAEAYGYDEQLACPLGEPKPFHLGGRGPLLPVRQPKNLQAREKDKELD